MKGHCKSKPAKPRPDFPLFSHNNSLWCKKIHGKAYYFGSWKSDPNGERAVAKYELQKSTLHGSKQPVAEVPLASLVTAYLYSKMGCVSPGTLKAYTAVCREAVLWFGSNCEVASITEDDFSRLHAYANGRWNSAHVVRKFVVCIRMLFRFAYEHRIVDKPLRFGASFSPVPAPGVRAVKSSLEQEVCELSRAIESRIERTASNHECNYEHAKPVIGRVE